VDETDGAITGKRLRTAKGGGVKSIDLIEASVLKEKIVFYFHSVNHLERFP